MTFALDFKKVRGTLNESLIKTNSADENRQAINTKVHQGIASWSCQQLVAKTGVDAASWHPSLHSDTKDVHGGVTGFLFFITQSGCTANFLFTQRSDANVHTEGS